MLSIRQDVVAKLRQDHDYMIELMNRILAQCDRRDDVDHCGGCSSTRRSICHGDIGHQILHFVEVSLRHNLVESSYMSDGVPAEHRIAHNRAHLEIAEQLRLIRRNFVDSGNGVIAIDAVERAMAMLKAHIAEYDAELETYLLAEA